MRDGEDLLERGGELYRSLKAVFGPGVGNVIETPEHRGESKEW
jgi:hypothetical protein